MESVDRPDTELTFLTKKDFLNRAATELFSIEPTVEQELKSFKEDDMLAIELSINSPAIVKKISDGNDVVAFMEKKFQEEGFTQDQINQAFRDAYG